MTDTSKIAEAIINALRYRDVKPDGEFTSASGINHGTVESWTISDGKSVVAYGNNAQTDYEISDYTTEDHTWCSRNQPSWRRLRRASQSDLPAPHV
jgi:hypothetical protein